MSVEEVRKYARRTAEEFKRKGIRAERLESTTVTYRQEQRKEGWLFKRTVTASVPETRKHTYEGWPVWSQDLTIAVWRSGPGADTGDWTIRRTIWLRPSGELLNLSIKRAQWQACREPFADVVESASPASDSDITFADWPFHPYPRDPRVSNSKRGLFESHTGLRQAATLAPGMRISRGLTALRKSKGTYVARQPPAGRP